MFHRVVLALICLAIISCSEESKQKETSTESANRDFGDLSFWSDAAPIVFDNCTPCHHEGGGAPFPLTKFEDIKKRSKTIRQVIADKYMPPWPANPEFSHFKDEKRLSAHDIQIMLTWIDQGALEGVKPENAPKPEILPDIDLGEPDLVLPFPDTVFLPGNNKDLFRIAKIPFELETDTIIKAIHFKPGNKQLVHHVNGHLINYNADLKENVEEGEWIIDAEIWNSLEAYKRMKIAHDDGTYPTMRVSAFNYLPGVEAMEYPQGIGGLYLNKKAAILMNTLHYGPSALDTFDNSTIEVYFADGKPERPVLELHMGTQGITSIEPDFIIPANEVKTFRTRYILPQSISVLTVNPHMHLLGKEFKAYAFSNSTQDTIPLIHIPEWDFRWQYFYTYERMLTIPKGYIIEVIATFDNTINNPFNPHNPPKTLSEAGKNMKTTDEMFQFFVNYLPYKEGDEKIEL